MENKHYLLFAMKIGIFSVYFFFFLNSTHFKQSTDNNFKMIISSLFGFFAVANCNHLLYFFYILIENSSFDQGSRKVAVVVVVIYCIRARLCTR